MYVVQVGPNEKKKTPQTVIKLRLVINTVSFKVQMPVCDIFLTPKVIYQRLNRVLSYAKSRNRVILCGLNIKFVSKQYYTAVGVFYPLVKEVTKVQVVGSWGIIISKP